MISRHDSPLLQIGFAGEKTLAGIAGDEVLGGPHAVTYPGELSRRCCAPLASGTLLSLTVNVEKTYLAKPPDFIHRRRVIHYPVSVGHL